ncbi:MAG TPA: DUF4262 domain-containing protein [Acidimicrobiales bacterium]|nr:DUF4262 domain-containing protein [Acidimicrobiales bacterium]
MCIICDGASDDEVHTGEFVRIAMHGFTMIGIEGSPTWTYTIGLVPSFGHPELVMTGVSMPTAADLLTAVVERVREGVRFDTDSPPLSLCSCTSVAFGAVHPAQWERGRFNGWLSYYDWLGEDLPSPDALQVLWPNKAGRFPPDPDFCLQHGDACQPLLDGVPRHDVNRGGNRQQRRRRKHGHGKRGRR